MVCGGRTLLELKFLNKHYHNISQGLLIEPMLELKSG